MDGKGDEDNFIFAQLRLMVGLPLISKLLEQSPLRQLGFLSSQQFANECLNQSMEGLERKGAHVL